jgi:hypothetical protein
MAQTDDAEGKRIDMGKRQGRSIRCHGEAEALLGGGVGLAWLVAGFASGLYESEHPQPIEFAKRVL